MSQPNPLPSEWENDLETALQLSLQPLVSEMINLQSLLAAYLQQNASQPTAAEQLANIEQTLSSYRQTLQSLPPALAPLPQQWSKLESRLHQLENQQQELNQTMKALSKSWQNAQDISMPMSSKQWNETSAASNWGSELSWKGSIGLVAIFSLLVVALNHFSFLLLPPRLSDQGVAYLQGIWQRTGWSNTKLERIEKNLGINSN
jgi:hypothetical protein